MDLVKGDVKLIGDEHNEIAMKLKVVSKRYCQLWSIKCFFGDSVKQQRLY